MSAPADLTSSSWDSLVAIYKHRWANQPFVSASEDQLGQRIAELSAAGSSQKLPGLFYIYNYRNNTFEYLSTELLNFLGIGSPESLPGPEAALPLLHPEEMPTLLFVLKASLDSYNALPDSQRPFWRMRVCYRLRRADGQYSWVQHALGVLGADANGSLLYSQGQLTLIDEYKTNDRILWSFGLEEPGKGYQSLGSHQQGPNPSQFTPKEMELLKLISRGNNTRAIAQQLGRSEHTILTRRKQLLQKTACHNAAELVDFAMAVGIY